MAQSCNTLISLSGGRQHARNCLYLRVLSWSMLPDCMQAADQINENLLLCVWQTAARITAEKLIHIPARTSWVPFLHSLRLDGATHTKRSVAIALREFFTWPTKYSPIT
jgi:hypothetical protein